MVEDNTSHPTTDDRNEELDKSPVPDPQAGETSADDDPVADQRSARDPAAARGAPSMSGS
jgi:hypothetical protein